MHSFSPYDGVNICPVQYLFRNNCLPFFDCQAFGLFVLKSQSQTQTQSESGSMASSAMHGMVWYGLVVCELVRMWLGWLTSMVAQRVGVKVTVWGMS